MVRFAHVEWRNKKNILEFFGEYDRQAAPLLSFSDSSCRLHQKFRI